MFGHRQAQLELKAKRPTEGNNDNGLQRVTSQIMTRGQDDPNEPVHGSVLLLRRWSWLKGNTLRWNILAGKTNNILISEMRVKQPLFGIGHSPWVRDRAWCVQTGLELTQKKQSLNWDQLLRGCLGMLCRWACKQEWMFPTGSMEVCSSNGKYIVSEKRFGILFIKWKQGYKY